MIHDGLLLAELATLKEEMDTKNTDLVIAVFGDERTGKSTFAANLVRVLDSTFSPDVLPNRTCLTFQDFARIVPTIKPYQVVWCDEFGWYSKRGAYDTDVNRVLLQYFQEAGGSKRIYVLLFPELAEIDRKVIQRARLFFETVRRNGEYFVRGWTKEQIDIKIREMRLPSPATRAKLWAGCSKIPRVFRCDYKGIEDIIIVYKELKLMNLARTDDKLAEYSKMTQREFALQLQFEIKKDYGIDYSPETLRKEYIRPLTREYEDEFGEDSGIFRGERDIIYKDEKVREKIKSEILERLRLKRLGVPQTPRNTNKNNIDILVTEPADELGKRPAHLTDRLNIIKPAQENFSSQSKELS